MKIVTPVTHSIGNVYTNFVHIPFCLQVRSSYIADGVASSLWELRFIATDSFFYHNLCNWYSIYKRKYFAPYVLEIYVADGTN